MAERFGIYFLDVGQGDCSVLCPPSAAPVLVDCADATTASHFVADLGINAFSAVIVSHLDSDHIRGMLRFLTHFISGGGKVSKLYIDKDRPQLSDSGLALLRQALAWQREGLLQLHPPMSDPRPVCRGNGWAITVVLPQYPHVLAYRVANKQAPNLVSAAVRVQCFGRAVLVGGDAPLDSWENLKPRLLKADVLRAPHHGGDLGERVTDWTVADLYRRVAPQIAVFSVGTTNSYQHPRREHMDAAVAGGSCRRICTQLTERCHPAPQELRRAALMNVARISYSYVRHTRSRASEVPCAGSVMICIDEEGRIEMEPSPDGWHEAFIARTAHPLCRSTSV